MGEMEWKCICTCALQEEKKKEERGHLFWRVGVIKSNIFKWEGNVECLSEDNDDEEDAVNRRAKEGGGCKEREIVDEREREK